MGRDKKSKQFSEHTSKDVATKKQQQQQEPSAQPTPGSANNETGADTSQQQKLQEDLPPLTWKGKFVLFFGFPLSIGLLGLYAGYLQKREDPTRQLNFDDDFAYPFVLALCLVLVVGFRTGWFTSSKQKPLVQWPKVKKRRKIIHKHVVAGQDPNDDVVDDEEEEDEDDDEPEKDEISKKDD